MPYPNAMAGKEIQNEYGISRFPTTFLIDPKGVIVGKDLRGEKLLDLVKDKMKEYEEI